MDFMLSLLIVCCVIILSPAPVCAVSFIQLNHSTLFRLVSDPLFYSCRKKAGLLRPAIHKIFVHSIPFALFSSSTFFKAAFPSSDMLLKSALQSPTGYPRSFVAYLIIVLGLPYLKVSLSGIRLLCASNTLPFTRLKK